LSTDRYDDDRDRDRKRSTDARRFEPPPPPRFDSAPLSRSSNYDRDRGTSDIKKRLDDFPSKRSDDSYSSKRDTYKSGHDDFKRDLDLPRHSSSSYGSSNRVESSSSVNKERYAERSTSDYRGTTIRSDDRDSRNGSGKPRYVAEPQAETRFNERSNVAASTAWSSGAPHQPFSLNSTGIWAEKQPENNANAWRALDDRYGERYASNDRKPVIPSQFIEPTVRSNQFIAPHSTIIPGGRFPNNRYDNGRF